GAGAGAGTEAGAGARWRWIWTAVGIAARVLALSALMWPGPTEAPTTTASARAEPAMRAESAPGAWLRAGEAAAPEVVPPSQVTIAFSIEPRGARVMRDGALVGLTPFVHRVDASAERVRYTIAAEGHDGK